MSTDNSGRNESRGMSESLTTSSRAKQLFDEEFAIQNFSYKGHSIVAIRDSPLEVDEKLQLDRTVKMLRDLFAADPIDSVYQYLRQIDKDKNNVNRIPLARLFDPKTVWTNGSRTTTTPNLTQSFRRKAIFLHLFAEEFTSDNSSGYEQRTCEGCGKWGAKGLFLQCVLVKFNDDKPRCTNCRYTQRTACSRYVSSKTPEEAVKEAKRLVYEEYTAEMFAMMKMTKLESFITRFNSHLKRRRQEMRREDLDDKPSSLWDN